MKNKIFNLLLVLSCLPLASCSVYMASQQKGASADEIANCKTRTCLLNKGAVTITQQTNKAGTVTEETMQVQKPTGSAARAVMHGALDVATLGVWEVAGTPVEGVLNKPDKYGIKVHYRSNGEDIQRIELG